MSSKLPTINLRFAGSHLDEPAKWRAASKNQWTLLPTNKASDYRQPIGEVCYNKPKNHASIIVRSRHGDEAYRTGPAFGEDAARDYLIKQLTQMAANPEWVRGFDDFHRPRGEHTSDLTPSTAALHPYAVEWLSRFATRINTFERHFAGPVRLASLAGAEFMRGKNAREALAQIEWAVRESGNHLASGMLPKTGWEGQRLLALHAWAKGLVTIYGSGKLDKHMWSGDLQAHRTVIGVRGKFAAAL